MRTMFPFSVHLAAEMWTCERAECLRELFKVLQCVIVVKSIEGGGDNRKRGVNKQFRDYNFLLSCKKVTK